jgi:putative transposase
VATPLRFQGPGYFHVYTRATRSIELLSDDVDRTSLVHAIRTTAERLAWRLYGFSLLTTHYHAVFEATKPNLSQGMQRINSAYVRGHNERSGRYGTVVAGRFGCRIIEDDEYLWEVCRYVFLNPVRAGLCRRAQEWPWSGGILFPAASSL